MPWRSLPEASEPRPDDPGCQQRPWALQLVDPLDATDVGSSDPKDWLGLVS